MFKKREGKKKVLHTIKLILICVTQFNCGKQKNKYSIRQKKKQSGTKGYNQKLLL